VDGGETHSGGCMCGAVRFTARGAPRWTAYCHCSSCRKHTGAPVAAYAGYPEGRITFTTGAPAFYASSPGVRRGFCATCGSTLTYEGERWPGEIHIHIGAFDDPTAFPPGGHAYQEERLPWLHLVD
jgi:hypothetical protein